MTQVSSNVSAAVLATLLLGYVPIVTVMPFDRLPRPLYHARMVPFFLGLVVLGVLLSRAGRVVWAVAIGVARVAFQDILTRIGVLGNRSSWRQLHEFEPVYQGIWLAVALVINIGVYYGLMTFGSWAYQRWRMRGSRASEPAQA